MTKQILVVGAGFSGAVIARELAEAGYTVRVIDSRDHIAGNAYDYINDQGIVVHKYGPHLFHTNNETVFKYLSKFTEWVDYKHKVKAILKDGQYVTLPVNRETARIVGKENIIDTFFRPYSEKMWGMKLEELDPSIMNRIPVRDDDNELYFPNDEFQCLPQRGYTELIGNMLNHPNITVQLNYSFQKGMLHYYHHTFNSMPIDVFYDFEHGELPYRSIKFHTVNLPLKRALPTATVNFTHDGPCTRVTEWKLLPGHVKKTHGTDVTTVTFEEPCDYKDNNMERYYPVKDLSGKNRDTYKLYAAMDTPKMTFIGRTGLYAYLDMHQAVSSALAIAKRFLQSEENNDE